MKRTGLNPSFLNFILRINHDFIIRLKILIPNPINPSFCLINFVLGLEKTKESSTFAVCLNVIQINQLKNVPEKL